MTDYQGDIGLGIPARRFEHEGPIGCDSPDNTISPRLQGWQCRCWCQCEDGNKLGLARKKKFWERKSVDMIFWLCCRFFAWFYLFTLFAYFVKRKHPFCPFGVFAVFAFCVSCFLDCQRWSVSNLLNTPYQRRQEIAERHHLTSGNGENGFVRVDGEDVYQ